MKIEKNISSSSPRGKNISPGSSFSSFLVATISLANVVIVADLMTLNSRRKFEVAGEEEDRIHVTFLELFSYEVYLLFSLFCGIPSIKVHIHVGMGITGHYGINNQYFTFPSDVYVFLASTFKHVKQKHWTKIRMFLDFRSVLSPLVSAELIERYSFRSIVPSTGLHDPVPLPPLVLHEREIYLEEYKSGRAYRVSLKIDFR